MSLLLLQPDQLPSSEPELRIPRGAQAHHGLARRLAAGHASADLLDRLRALPATPGGMAFAHRSPATARPAIPYAYDERLREYDRYFDVVRVDAPLRGVYPHSLLIAYRSLLEEGLGCGTRLSWRQWSSLCTTLQAMICFLIGAEPPAGSVPVARPPMLRWHLDPHRRWQVGHHVFFVLTQSIVVALNCLRHALAAGDLAGARRATRLAATLLAGSAAAFVFTSEFSGQQYRDGVRPSMEPPFVAAGFSGLLSPDHHYLVRLFALLRPTLRELPAELAEEHRMFVRALGSAYESHKYVCARFGGDAGASLRMNPASGLPAVDVIHALKLARTRLVRRP